MADQQLLDKFDELIDAVSGQSSAAGGGGGGSNFRRARSGSRRSGGDIRETASNQKFEVLQKDNINILKKIEKHAEKEEKTTLQIMAGSKFMQRTLEDIKENDFRGIRAYNKLPGEFKKIFEKHGGTAKTAAQGVRSHSDLIRLENRMTRMREAELELLDRKNSLNAVELKRLKRLSKMNSELGKAFAETSKKLSGKGRFARGMAGASGGGGMGGFMKGIVGKVAGGAITAVSGILVGMAGSYLDEVRTMMKAGFFMDLEDMGKAAVEFGMNAKEGAVFYGKNKDLIYASNIGLEKFNTAVAEGADRTHSFTGSQKEAAEFSAQNLRFVRGFGDANIDNIAAMKRQEEMFESSARAFGMSIEEFNSIRNTLIKDEGVQKSMLMLRADQREGLILGIQAQVEFYKTMGYTNEQAMAVANSFNALVKESPVERMKKGAKMSAMMGMLGMGGQSAELRDLMMRAPTLDEGGRKRLQTLKREAFNTMGKSMQGSEGFPMMEQIMHQMGYQEEMLTQESLTKQGLEVDKEAMKKGEAQHKETLDAFSRVTGGLDTLRALGESSLGVQVGLMNIGAISSGLVGGSADMIGLINKSFPEIGNQLGLSKVESLVRGLAGETSRDPLEISQERLGSARGNVQRRKRNMGLNIQGYQNKLAQIKADFESEAIAGVARPDQLAHPKGQEKERLRMKTLFEKKMLAEKEAKEEMLTRHNMSLEKLDKLLAIEQEAMQDNKKQKEFAGKTEKNTKEGADAAKKQVEEDKKSSKGYRLKYLRAQGTAQSAS